MCHLKTKQNKFIDTGKRLLVTRGSSSSGWAKWVNKEFYKVLIKINEKASVKFKCGSMVHANIIMNISMCASIFFPLVGHFSLVCVGRMCMLGCSLFHPHAEIGPQSLLPLLTKFLLCIWYLILSHFMHF